MESIITKIKRFGPGSLGIIIPAEYAEIMNFNEGNIVKVQITQQEEQNTHQPQPKHGRST